jgi:hypothetical protein
MWPPQGAVLFYAYEPRRLTMARTHGIDIVPLFWRTDLSRVIWLALVLVAPLMVYAQRPGAATRPTLPSQALPHLIVLVTDENGIAVPGAHVRLTANSAANPINVHCETDAAGRCFIRGLRPGMYILHVEKPGFYRLKVPQVQVGQTEIVDARISHQQEIKESIEVQESVPAIDAERTADMETLTMTDIVNVPYPGSHDIRNVLPLIPGVVRDQSGNIHVGGASVTQTLNVLDGFNIGPPTTSIEGMHVNTDAVRTIDAETGRYSAEYGKGTSVLGMGTGTGDDRFRFTATNFIPSFQLRRGLNLNGWVPRATFSGPIKKGKAWFFVAPDAEYDQTIFTELPEGADRSHFWRLSNLAKLQVNLTSANILSTELLVNYFHAPNSGLSQFNPIESTQNYRANSWMAAVRDQHYFRSGALLELGVAVSHFNNASSPVGYAPYTVQPGTVQGSFYETSRGEARRVQGIANVAISPKQWHGSHEIKFGLDMDHIFYTRAFNRESISFLRTDGTLARYSTFPGLPKLAIDNFEATAYAQDRWSPSDRLLFEYGARLDWDQIIRDPLVSPRLAATYTFGEKRQTKVSAGVGIFYQATNLDLVAQDQGGIRLDTFYGPDGIAPLAPAKTTQFLVDRGRLQEPRFVTSSLGLEQELPRAIFLRVDFLDKRSRNGFVFVNRVPTQAIGDFELTNTRTIQFDSVTLTGRHTFKREYPFLLSYTRSRAHTNRVFDFNLGTPVIGLQQGGALPWDTPNRIVSWGWAPFFKKTLLGYAVEWRDGFPFSAVNQLQEVAGTAQSYRFPSYFTLTLSLEKRFRIFGYYLALRGSVENITSNSNPMYVNNNIDSAGFLTFEGTGHRAATARIRLLGRSKGKTRKTSASGPDKP